MNAASNLAPESARRPDGAAGRLIAGQRAVRRLSRSQLARAAGLGPRRLGDIEAGSPPEPAELLALAAALDLSLRRRNALFAAAGHTPLYKEWSLAEPAMAEARRAITLMLTRHEPWPAMVVDRRWTVLAANDAAQRLIRLMLGEGRLARPMNLMHMLLGPDDLRRQIVNWPALAPTLLRRVHHATLAAPDDEALRSLWDELMAWPEVAALAAAPGPPPPGALGEIRLVSQGRDLGLIGTTVALAAPQEVTLDELRLEAFLPADDASETLLLALAGGV